MVPLSLFLLYFVPSMIAWYKGSKDFERVFVINLAFGWTVLVWLGLVGIVWEM